MVRIEWVVRVARVVAMRVVTAQTTHITHTTTTTVTTVATVTTHYHPAPPSPNVIAHTLIGLSIAPECNSRALTRRPTTIVLVSKMAVVASPYHS